MDHNASVAGRISRLATTAAILIGLLALVGWILDIATLKSILPNTISMKVNTAICFVLASIAILLLRPDGNASCASNPATWIGGVVALAGLATFAQYLIGVDFGIDNILYREPAGAVETAYPGRMAPTTALNFFFLGSALLALCARRYWFSQIMAALALLIALFAIVGYAYDVRPLYGIPAANPIAFHTAVAFLLLAVGVLCAQPTHGLMAIVTNETTGGVAVRRLLPVALLLPIGFGWLILLGENAGLYGERFGLALFALSMTVALTLILFLFGHSLRVADERRRRLESDLVRQTALMKSILTDIGDGVAVADREGKIILWNPAAERILGLGITEAPPDEWSHHYGIFLPDRVTPYPPERLPLARAVRGETVKADELFVRNAKVPQGTWISVTGTPLKDEEGLLQGGVAAFQDIGEQKQREEERLRSTALIEAANKELEAFSYSVSHDLRAPLRAIDGYSRMIEEDFGGRLDDEGRRLLTVIRTNTRTMGQLIDDLLSFSRMGRKELIAEAVDMEELARAVANDLVPADRRIALNVAPLPAARADRAMIRQVWANLIANAVKFTRTRERAVIEIAGTAVNGMAEYVVKDNGVGFDMRYVDKLFGVFQRLHRVEEFEGTGVGLAIVQRIVNRHGGSVRAEGRVNEGATIRFSLPV